jgi:hypothetical protein
MLPIPLRNYLPKPLVEAIDNGDAGGIALVNKLESLIEEWGNDALELYYIKVPDRCPANVLNFMGEYLAADINEFDTETEKRKKISNAIATHKQRTLFDDDVKPKIDAITGASSSIWGNIFSDDSFFVGGVSWVPSGCYWSTFAIDGIDNDLGDSLIGGYDEAELSGVVYIDLGTSTATADEINKIIITLQDSVPAYYKVFIGYENGSGQFVIQGEI